SMRERPGPFTRKKKKLVEQPGEELAQPLADARAGDVDRVEAQAQPPSDLGPGPAEEDRLPERLPGGGLGLRFEEGEGPGEQLRPLLRLAGEVRALRLRQLLQRAGRRADGLLAAAQLAPAVGQDDAQPGAETAAGLVAERGHLLDEDGEDFLEQVGGVVVVEAGAPRPAVEEGRVELDETLPGVPVVRAAEAFEQAERGRVHGRRGNARAFRASPTLRTRTSATSTSLTGRAETSGRVFRSEEAPATSGPTTGKVGVRLSRIGRMSPSTGH